MALLTTFKPMLSTCMKSCSALSFSDCAGLYNGDSNPNGWGALTGDPTTVGVTDVTKATITLIKDGNVEFVYDVTTQIPTAINGTFTFTDYKYDVSDGEYEVNYLIVDSNGTNFTYSTCFYSTCQIDCCIDKAVAKLPAAYTDCNNCYIDSVNLLKSLQMAMNSAAICDKLTIANNIKDVLKRFCDLTCNC